MLDVNLFIHTNDDLLKCLIHFKYNSKDHFYYTACINFRTDGIPNCCPFYFLKNKFCEGKFHKLSTIFRNVLTALPLTRMTFCVSLDQTRQMIGIQRSVCGRRVTILRRQHRGQNVFSFHISNMN